MIGNNFRKSAFRLFGLVLLLVGLSSCVSNERYLGNGMWAKSDGTTYQGAVPLAVTNVVLTRKANLSQHTLSQDDRVLRAVNTIGFSLTVTLENGETHVVRFDDQGKPGDTASRLRSFKASNGMTYNVRASYRMTRTYQPVPVEVRSKGLPDFRRIVKVG